jgi:hypothetical protein
MEGIQSSMSAIRNYPNTLALSERGTEMWCISQKTSKMLNCINKRLSQTIITLMKCLLTFSMSPKPFLFQHKICYDLQRTLRPFRDLNVYSAVIYTHSLLVEHFINNAILCEPVKSAVKDQ